LEKNKNDIDYLSEVVNLIDEATLPQIDFDELKARLSTVHSRLTAQDELATEYALLRDDCERRIAGMTKAIAVVDRKQDRMEEALALVDELPALDSARLLQTYRRVTARFRDCFPGSFGYCNQRERDTRSRVAARDGR
jgi:hypothetical protein